MFKSIILCIFMKKLSTVIQKFYDLLLFSPWLRSNSSHCQLMDLFISKASFKEKVDSEWFLERYQLFKIIVRICKKMFEFCGKPSKFLTKSCLLIFCIFCLIEDELIHQLHLRKYVENEIFCSSSQKAKKVQKYNPTS